MKTHFSRSMLVWCALLAIALPSRSRATSIGLFSSPDCTSCNLTIPQGQQGTFYIRLTGTAGTEFATKGLASAEFRVEGVPAGWIDVVQPNPAASFVQGNPVQGGAIIAFNAAQFGECIPLFTVTLFATSEVTDVLLYVTQHSTPSNPNWLCPHANPMDPPVFGGRVCVDGGALRLNSSVDCQVAVEATTWSGVRQLFR